MLVLPYKVNNPRKTNNRHPKIVAAAVSDMNRNFIYSMPPPNRHHHVLIGMMVHSIVAGQEGFLTDMDTFVDREVGLIYALSNKQVRIREGALPTDYDGEELFSEDMW